MTILIDEKRAVDLGPADPANIAMGGADVGDNLVE